MGNAINIDGALMNIERILKYCHDAIGAEKKNNIPSVDKIKTLEGVLNFINNADIPEESERIEIKEIFKKQHKDFKGTFYVFTKKDDVELDGIINQIKQEMAANMESYSDMTVGQFFELFITNMDDFWKKQMFTTWGVNKKFRDILGQVLSKIENSKNRGRSGGNNKPSYSSVMGAHT